jgi:excisionase family DNA binding protein
MERNEAVGKRLYTPKEAAHYLGHTVPGVRALLKNGKLPFIQNGRNGKQFIDIRDIDQFIEKSKRSV